MKNLSAKILGLSLLLVSCNKLQTQGESNPLVFSGITSVQSSSDSSLILSWKIPFTVQLENYEVYVLQVQPEDVKSLLDTVDTQKAAESKDSKGASDKTNTSSTTSSDTADISKIVYPTGAFDLKAKGKLVALVSADHSSFHTASLDEGIYLFQVRALSNDGRRDSNTAARLVTINASQLFKGLQIAEVIGSDAHLKWLPYPNIRSTDTYQYNIYKGPAFNEKVAFTKDSEYLYSLLNESSGDTLYFGIRFVDAQGNEDTNSTLIPLTVPVINKNYLGCLSVQGVGADRIKVNFEWPSENYKSMVIYRDQQQAFVTLDRNITSFIDRGLAEGEYYTYTCQGVTGKDIVAGSNQIKGATLSSNPPTFKGITNVASGTDPHSAKVSWGVTTGVPAQAFQVYANAGTSVNWAADPVAKLEPNVLATSVGGLGDDLPYAFGVRACGLSVCDPNSEQLLLTTPDAGAPLSVGATSAVITSGQILIQAPWKPTDGGVAKRKVYLKLGGDPTPDIRLYTLAQTVLVTDVFHPPAILSIGNLLSATTYNIIVRDEDSHGNISSNTNVVSATVGDLRPPDFNGLNVNGLLVGTAGQEETTLVANFRAIQNFQQLPRGAVSYRLYLREGGGGSCAEDYYKLSLDALQVPEGDYNYTITGLKPKTLYSVCLKATDVNGNLSTNSNYLSRQTQDKTAPDFDGIQTLSFDAVAGLVKLTWNPSRSSDAASYKIDTWLTLKNIPTPLPITILRSIADSPSSYAFDSSVVPFESEATLEVVVNACDSADSIPGGSKNCSVYSRSQALRMTFADINPPPSFMGISASSDLVANTQGVVTVKWIDPSDWSDYAGFQVYTLDKNNALTLVKDCPCTLMPGCQEHLNSCDVSGLDDFRTYRFHVRAYDSAKNFTILDPTMSYADKRTVDLTKPNFVSNLSLAFQDGGALLNWAPATDNQYASEPGATLTYRVYRKASTNFANLLNPSAGGPPLATIADKTYFDAANLVSGTWYYYTVCAVDASGNEACDGTYKSVQTPDLVPPVISSLTTNKTTSSKSWNLSWAASDNTTSNGNLLFRVKVRMSALPTEKVQDSDPTIFTQTGAVTATGLTGPINTDTYIHYLLMVTDEAGNTTTKQIDLYSQNMIAITAVRTAEGPTTGNRLLLVEGSGFHSSSNVTLGGSNCQNTQVVSSRHILCRTPAKALGTYSLTISNSDGSSTTLNSAYTYCTANVNCTNICNNPNSWETNFAIQTNRGTSSSTPYIICNATHLNNMRTIANNRYFSMMDNIDLSGVAWTPLVTNSGAGFQGTFTGNGNIIANFSYNNSSTDDYGFFKYIYGNSKVSALKFVNVNLTGRDRVAALSGDSAADANTVIQDIMVAGTVTGRQYVGGVMGRAMVQTFNIASYSTVSGQLNVGGIFGYKQQNAATLYFEGSVTAVPVSTSCYAGGLVGYWDGNGGTASDLTAIGTVTCARASTTEMYETGGLIGRLNNHSVSTASFSGTVIGDRRTAGGIGTLVRGTADGIQVTGAVNGGNVTYGGGAETGGIIGLLYRATLKNSSSSATVTTYNTYTGGLVGNSSGGNLSSGSEPHCLIQSSAAYGDVTNVIAYRTGGIVGNADYTDIVSSSSNGSVKGGKGQVGGVIGWAGSAVTADSSFSNSNVDGTGFDHVGGFVGYMDTWGPFTFSNSFAKGDVVGNNNVGGFAGICRGNFTKDYASGKVSGNAVVGGFCGRTYDLNNGVAPIPASIIDNSYATGSVTATVDHAGGFIGHLYRNMEIRYSYATGDVTADSNVGGFMGSIDQGPAVVEKNYAKGTVVGKNRVGGFLGYGYRYDSTMLMQNNYSWSNVTGESDVGGFAGYSGAVISKSYSAGKVSQGQTASNMGGFLGRFVTGGTLVAPECYWDTTTSGRATSAGGTGKATIDMKDANTFVNYDASIWKIQAGSYPTLQSSGS